MSEGRDVGLERSVGLIGVCGASGKIPTHSEVSHHHHHCTETHEQYGDFSMDQLYLGKMTILLVGPKHWINYYHIAAC